MTRQVDFVGSSGTVYRYSVLDETRPLTPGGANYLVVEVNDGGTVVLFAGETDSLSRGDWRIWLDQARRDHPEAEVMMRLNVLSAVRRAELEDLVEGLGLSRAAPGQDGPDPSGGAA